MSFTKKNILLKLAFSISFVMILIGALLKIQGADGEADILLSIGIVGTLCLTLIALYEVHTSNRLSMTDKLIWTIGFLCFNGITGIFYFFLARRKVTSEQ